MAQEILKVIKQHLSLFLEQKGYRKTNERFAILEEIYDRNDHFGADELYFAMHDKNYPVSRGTVYNTLEMLEECGLVLKHQFDRGVAARYEKAYGRKQHDHLFCLDCKQIREFCDPRLQVIQNMVNEVFDCEIMYHSLTFYSKCKKADCINKAHHSADNELNL